MFTATTRSAWNPNPSSSWRVASLGVTVRPRRYSGGAIRVSITRPSVANGPGSSWSHIGPWTWWRKVIRGLRVHTGLSHGTPFHTSTIASNGPIRPTISLANVRGNTV